MDPVSTAIIAALSAGAASGVTDAAKQAMVDAYHGLKTLISKRFGSDSEVGNALEKLQAKPDSDGRKQTLAEELKAVNAAAEPDLVTAAQSLLALIKALPQGEQHIQQAKGIGIAQASEGSTASVHIYGPLPAKPED